MDMLYDVQGAATALEENQRWVDDEKEYLHAFVQMPGWETAYSLQFTKEPESWRLVKTVGEGETGEEVIFTMQAVVQDKQLPPIVEQPKIPRTKFPYLQQSVTLTGLGTHTFEESIAAMHKLHTVFSRHFPEGRLQTSQTRDAAAGSVLTMSNRYFTKKSEAGQMESVPFSKDVDPRGILTKMVNNKLMHGQENEVEYFTRHSDLGRVYKYLKGHPQNFRIGDIVEVQFSLVVYKMRAEHYILKPMLYSLVLLDGKFANELALKQSTIIINPVLGKPLKRKIGYILEQGKDVGMAREDDVLKRSRWSDISSERSSMVAEPIDRLESMHLDH